MVLYNELPVYRDSYNLLLEIYKATNKFSHEYKYCLGQDMKRDVLNLFRSLYRANRAVEKHQPLEEFLDDFELLKIEIRMCGDLRLLPIKKVAELALLTDAIGRQITAWKNKSRAALHSAKPAKKIFCRRLLWLLCGNRPNQGLDRECGFLSKKDCRRPPGR